MADHHDHDHPHEHTHDDHDHHDHEHHDHEHGHDDHEHGTELVAMLREAIPFLHGHSHGQVNIDNALEASERGIWALKVSLAILAITALIQIGIFAISGSVGLLADTI